MVNSYTKRITNHCKERGSDMDLNSIGVNYNAVKPTRFSEERKRRIQNKTKTESESEQARPKDNRTSVENSDKGRVVDVEM
jgi:hypothetical protein